MGTELREAAWLARCTGRGDLSPFAPREMAALADTIGARHVAAGTPLMGEAKPIQAIGIILEGSVELTRRAGVRRVVLQVLHAGDVYGDIPFLCHMAPPFSARALTAVDVVELDGQALSALLAARPEVCQRFLFSVASRLQRMQQRLLALTSGDLLHQVTSLLLDETGGETGTIALTQSTIAELLGASRSNVNRALRELEAQGFVALGYRRVEVVDSVGLHGLAT